ncbi:hypothetical protein KSS87_023569 [Heliosperma pusillum]|nr:hypothetical protein KSS87_023569 [Heliosperma pusillum]
MHRVGSTGNASGSNRPRKEKRFTYVLNASDDSKVCYIFAFLSSHSYVSIYVCDMCGSCNTLLNPITVCWNSHCAGINCLDVLKSTSSDRSDYLFTGCRDGTLKRWALDEESATCSATFESHVDWVNDAVILGDHTLVSCSSDTTLKTWNCLSDGVCTKTLRQHSDYVTCLAAAGKNVTSLSVFMAQVNAVVWLTYLFIVSRTVANECPHNVFCWRMFIIFLFRIVVDYFQTNIVASGGLGGEVFVWDIEAAVAPVSKLNDVAEEELSNGINGGSGILPVTSLRTINSSSNISPHSSPSHGYVPTAAKGHKESVYALAMNDSGSILVSGGTEKVVRVWDPRSGSKTMKLRGHTDNVRALLLDSSGRYCISGSSDSMIRLWDLGQQRCVHSYAVHTDSVWALASTATFSHVYSGGRDQSLYLTDLSSRESILICAEEHPILQLALSDESIWVATTDSSVHRWPAEGQSPQKVFQKGGSFLAGNLSFSRARASLEGSSPIPVHHKPILTIPGTPTIVRHEVLNNRRHVLTKDTYGSVKLWEITRGVIIEDYGVVEFDEKKKELFEMVSIPAWFTVDTRLGSLSIHLDTPQCFSAEMYSVDLNIAGKPEDDKVNLARETLKGLLAHWSAKRKQRLGSQILPNGEGQPVKDLSVRSMSHSRVEMDNNAENDSMVYPPFEFSDSCPPSIITEGSQGGVWRKKITALDGTEDEKDFPWLGYLGTSKAMDPIMVVTYVVEKMVLEKPLDGVVGEQPFAPGLTGGPLQNSVAIGDGSLKSSSRPWQRLKPSIEIMCNNQVLSPDMSLATVRAYVWKKPEDLGIGANVLEHGS